MRKPINLAWGVLEGLAIVGLSHVVSVWWLMPLVVVYWYFVKNRLPSEQQLLYGLGLVGFAMVVVQNQNWIGQVLILVGHVVWRLAQQQVNSTRGLVVQTSWLQFITLTAIFGAEAIWHWPTILVLAIIYLASLLIAMDFFADGERASRALAATWGLIVAEAGFIFSVWLVNYVLPGNLLIIPQAAVVITALGYCFGSIYLAHKTSKLSRGRLAEYAIIGLCLISIVIAGTKWNGSI